MSSDQRESIQPFVPSQRSDATGRERAHDPTLPRMLHSVRARLTLWYTAILALVLIIFSAVSYVLLAREIRAETDASLTDKAHEFAAAFDPAEHARGRDALLELTYSDREILVLSSPGDVVMASKSRIGAEERNRIRAFVRAGGKGLLTIPGGEEGDGVRIMAMPITVRGTHYN